MRDTNDNRSIYTNFFFQELTTLNPAQFQAVNHIDGPMLVVAGPGTGKTHVLAARIGQILLETDALPENILCLTFTDAGVLAMRNRLLQFIGPTAHRVHIFTFHAFCNAIIQSNLEYFGRQDMEPLGALERIDLIRDLIDQLPPNHPLYHSQDAPYFYESHLNHLFQGMHKENWTHELVLEKVDAWLDSLPENPDFLYQKNYKAFKKGDIKEALVKAEHEYMRKLRAAAELYPKYEQHKRNAGRYDYDDMILWVLRAFKKYPFLLRNYQERYQFVLVDEYQDTNTAQNALLLQLLSYWDNPNIFIVGDDDQSIYEFQGARLQNLIEFITRYEASIEVVALTENYRSAQPILDAASALIKHNDLRIANHAGSILAQKHLHAANAAFQGTDTFLPVISQYPSRLHESTHIVQQIEMLLKEGIPAREIAIIYAQHTQARDILLLLQKKGIPYLTKRSINILETPLIQQLLLLLDYLYRESIQAHTGEFLLFKILHFQFWNIPARTLAAISLFLNQRDRSDTYSWREILHKPEIAVPDIEDQIAQQIQQAILALEELIAGEANLLLPNLIELTLNRSGLLHHVLHADSSKLQHIQYLHTFLDFVREEQERNPGLDLPELVQLLTRMQQNNIPLSLNQILGEEGGVQLLTAHSSKGLEFGYVFMLDCVKDYWESSSKGSRKRFKLPETLTFSGEEDAMEARRRVFYVAMTRAKRFLHLSYAKTNNTQKSLDHTQFIDELRSDYPYIVFQEPLVSKDMLIETQATLLLTSQTPILLASEKTFIEDRLAQFSLSISALNTFIKCPLGFYFEHILQVPRLVSAPTIYGTAMHVAMQKLFLKIQPTKPFPSEAEFLGFFEKELHRKRGYFHSKSFEKYLSQGTHYLKQLYQTNIHRWHKDVHVEYTVRKVEIDGVPVTGTIDKIEYYPGLVTGIIDYKTGRAKNELARPTEQKSAGGLYWRQLSFYKLLFEHLDRSSRQVTFGEIQYLEPDSQQQFQTFRLDFEPEDSRAMRQLIVSTYTRIQQKDFYTGCGKPECRWCSFIRQTRISSSLSNPETEALDD